MKKIAIAIALVAIALAGCTTPNSTPNTGGAYVDCQHCVAGSPGAPTANTQDADPFINFYLGAITDPAELNPPGSYIHNTNPLAVMTGG
jgi:hypothetical protein